jgi:hypothetical protein
MVVNNEILNLICKTFNIQNSAELVGKLSATAERNAARPQYGKAANPGQNHNEKNTK